MTDLSRKPIPGLSFRGQAVSAADPASAFVDWVLRAAPGSVLVYHRGLPMPADADLFAAARRARDQGRVTLSTRRTARGAVEYIARRRDGMARPDVFGKGRTE